MARNVSDEELQLKKRARRRLVGAIVLVTAVAVLLPMVLDSEPKPSNQSINIQIPSPDAGVLSTKPEPLKPADTTTAAVPVPQAETAKSEAKVEKPQETRAATKSETKPEPQTESKTESKPSAEAPKPAKTEELAKKEAPKKEAPKAKDAAKEKPKAAGGYVIQVAALSDAAKAKELQAKIAGGGLKAYTEVVQTAKGPVTRVRVGPYASREAAEKARPQLQKLQLDGKVVPR